MKCCTIEGCGSPLVARGWCRKHYGRWYVTGDPHIVRPPGFPRRSLNGCVVDGCGALEKLGSRGMCAKHYTRWFRHGDPTVNRLRAPRPRRDLMERIRERVVVTASGCWEWQGYVLPHGYGVIGVGAAKQYVHRAAWEYVNGPMPPKHHGHHTCANRSCCNPDHVEPMPAGDHQRHHHAGRRRSA